MSKRDAFHDAKDEAIRALWRQVCGERDQFQARLDAIAELLVARRIVGTKDNPTLLVLARGTPARELRAALKRWAPSKSALAAAVGGTKP